MPGRIKEEFVSKIALFQNKFDKIKPEINLNKNNEPIYRTEYNFKAIFNEFNDSKEEQLIFLDFALMKAVDNGNTDLVRYLLNFKINDTPVYLLTTDRGTLWKNASFHYYLQCNDRSVLLSSCKTLLGWAARHGQLKVVKCLVNEFDVDVNAYSEEGYTALHDAVNGDGIGGIQSGNKHGLIADFLIKSGADPTLKSKPLYSQISSKTPLEMIGGLKPVFSKLLMDVVYKTLPYLTMYQKKLPPYQIKQKVQEELQDVLSKVDKMDKDLFPIVLNYLAYDVNDTNLTSVVEENKSNLPYSI